jgi:eukaryotic-like serine/threonine-protein kinase
VLADELFVGTWDPGVRARLEERVHASDLNDAQFVFKTVQAQFDRYVEQWKAERVEACEGSRSASPGRASKARVTIECLEQQRTRLAALSSSLQHADEATIRYAVELLARLAPPAACALQAANAQASAFVDSPSAALEVERGLVLAETLQEQGKYEHSQVAAEQVLEQARARADLRAQAQALITLGRVSIDLRKFEGAAARALEAHARALEAGDAQSSAEALILLVDIYREQGAFERGELAVSLAEHSVARLGPNAQVDLALARGRLASSQERWDAALAALDQAYELARSVYDADHLRIAHIEVSRGIAASRSQRDLAGALTHYRRAREIFELHHGPVHVWVAQVHGNIGAVHARRGDLDEASAALGRALEIYQQLYEPDHPAMLKTMGNLAAIRYLKGETAPAIELTSEVLDARARLGEQDTPSYLMLEINLAEMLVEAGQVARARALYQHAYDRRLIAYGAEAPIVLVSLGLLSQSWALLGDRAAARPGLAPLREAVAELPEESKDLPTILASLYVVLTAGAEHEEALRVAERELGLARTAPNLDHTKLARATARVGHSLNALARHAEAKARLEAALTEFEASSAADQHLAVVLLFELGEAEAALNLTELARARYLRVIELLDDDPRWPARLASSHLALARMGVEAKAHTHAALRAFARLDYEHPDAAAARSKAAL